MRRHSALKVQTFAVTLTSKQVSWLIPGENGLDSLVKYLVGAYPDGSRKRRQQSASRNASYSSYLGMMWKGFFFCGGGVNIALLPSRAVRNHEIIGLEGIANSQNMSLFLFLFFFLNWRIIAHSADSLSNCAFVKKQRFTLRPACAFLFKSLEQLLDAAFFF